ncbi:hypothetical protein ZWY2020_055407 [Hordeum vulgare]|nr:hypothetical protein ZWY2020_055407 [Hordeum vulgare]
MVPRLFSSRGSRQDSRCAVPPVDLAALTRHLVPCLAVDSTSPAPPRPALPLSCATAPSRQPAAGSRPDRTRQWTPGARRCAAAEGTQPAAQPDLRHIWVDRVDHPVSKLDSPLPASRCSHHH